MRLSEEQSAAVTYGGDVYVSACPGSGKTRALTARIARGIQELPIRGGKVLAVTFTNRAADELRARIESHDAYESKKMWAGTIHSFALEWIIRPYAAFLEETRHGYAVIDEYEARKILKTLRVEFGVGPFDDVNTRIDKHGLVENQSPKAESVAQKYFQILKQRKKIDFDQVLYYAYSILIANPDIAEVIGSIFSVICIDEAQDISELQFSILSILYNSSIIKPKLFLVGDEDQAIYAGLGGVPKNARELGGQFEGSNFKTFAFKDNYRSTQRLVDYFSYFRSVTGGVSKSLRKESKGVISFCNQTVPLPSLPRAIATIIRERLDSKIPANEICVIAPQWVHIRKLTRDLIELLPDVGFDAPAISPFHGQHDNVWYLLSKIALTEPSGRLVSTRIRWASDIIVKFNERFSCSIEQRPMKLLQIVNSFNSVTKVGSQYLEECFGFFLSRLGLQLESNSQLKAEYDLFIEKTLANIQGGDGFCEDDIEVFRGFFKESTGVVINTCHGVKGEEYDTVVAFGLLRGFIPHWNDIIDVPESVGESSESKMLYVVCSRAKENLYLIAESGRLTKSKRAYETSRLLQGCTFQYD